MVKNPPTNAGDPRDAGSIPGSGRSPGGGNGNLFQYSCLGNSRYRGAWWATVQRVTKHQTWLIDWAHTDRSIGSEQENSTWRHRGEVWVELEIRSTCRKLGMIHWCTSCPGDFLGADLAFLSAPYLRLGTDWWTREGGQCRGNWEEECPQQPKSVLAEWGLDANFKHPLRHSLRQDFIIYQHLSFEQVLGRRPPMCNTFLCPPIWTLKNQTIFTRNPGQWLFQVAGKRYASHFLFPLCGWTMMP